MNGAWPGSKPEPFGQTEAVPLALAASQAQPLAENGTNQHSEGFTLSNPPGGNSQAYLLRRLARDAPEVLERVKAGDFKSARAAALLGVPSPRTERS